jgi:hypothetical protein
MVGGRREGERVGGGGARPALTPDHV